MSRKVLMTEIIVTLESSLDDFIFFSNFSDNFNPLVHLILTQDTSGNCGSIENICI